MNNMVKGKIDLNVWTVRDISRQDKPILTYILDSKDYQGNPLHIKRHIPIEEWELNTPYFLMKILLIDIAQSVQDFEILTEYEMHPNFSLELCKYVRVPQDCLSQFYEQMRHDIKPEMHNSYYQLVFEKGNNIDYKTVFIPFNMEDELDELKVLLERKLNLTCLGAMGIYNRTNPYVDKNYMEKHCEYLDLYGKLFFVK